MIVLGDFASGKRSIDISGLTKQSSILINCEGFLTEKDHSTEPVVFNNIELFKKLNTTFNIIANLANNHIMDVPDGVSQSLKLANSNSIRTVGAGKNLQLACKPLIFKDNEIEIAIISAGWDVIGCQYADENTEGVAPLDSLRLLKQVKNEKLLGRRVLVYLHWDYELEVYPQPTHRNLAMELIDAGADIVLGCHSHCVQGFETYKNKYIFYGLGNAVFDEKYFFNGRLSFPDFCKIGLAVDWNPLNGNVLVSTTKYEKNSLIFSEFIKPQSLNVINELSGFSNMSSRDYLKFFKRNRRKKKLLPIFFEKDTSPKYRIKRRYLSVRTRIIKNMFLLGLKGSSR